MKANVVQSVGTSGGAPTVTLKNGTTYNLGIPAQAQQYRCVPQRLPSASCPYAQMQHRALCFEGD